LVLAAHVVALVAAHVVAAAVAVAVPC